MVDFMNLLRKKIKLFLPESFEWLILNYSKDYFSWEQFFTKLLMVKTENTFMQYRKGKLNPVYLHDKNKKAVLDTIEGIESKTAKVW